MNKFLFVPIVALISACAGHVDDRCSTTNSGVKFYIDDPRGNYTDVSEKIRSGDFSDIVSHFGTSSNPAQETPGGLPRICKVHGPIARTVSIPLSPRSPDHVGADLGLYYNDEGEVEVAELYVVPKAP